MFEIVQHNKTRYFTLDQAQEMLPLIYRITEDSAKQVKYLMACVTALGSEKSVRALELQDQANLVIDKWQHKIERLGARPKGLWLADFDNGDGYYCWKFPEVKILYKHGYQDGFTGRILLENNEEMPHENCPCPN